MFYLDIYLQIIDIIAKGAFGNVVKVRRDDDKQYYAMKVLITSYVIIFVCKDYKLLLNCTGNKMILGNDYIIHVCLTT